MNEERAQFKHDKQLPAPDVKKGKRGKNAGKKPWTIEVNWRDDAIFYRRWSEKTGIDGKWVEHVSEPMNLEEYTAYNKKNGDWEFDMWCGWFGNYKNERAAMSAWESHKLKDYLYKKDERKIYTLINKQTGEERILK